MKGNHDHWTMAQMRLAGNMLCSIWGEKAQTQLKAALPTFLQTNPGEGRKHSACLSEASGGGPGGPGGPQVVPPPPGGPAPLSNLSGPPGPPPGPPPMQYGQFGLPSAGPRKPGMWHLPQNCNVGHANSPSQPWRWEWTQVVMCLHEPPHSGWWTIPTMVRC